MTICAPERRQLFSWQEQVDSEAGQGSKAKKLRELGALPGKAHSLLHVAGEQLGRQQDAEPVEARWAAVLTSKQVSWRIEGLCKEHGVGTPADSGKQGEDWVNLVRLMLGEIDVR